VRSLGKTLMICRMQENYLIRPINQDNFH